MPGISKKAWRSERREADGALLSLSSPTAGNMALFMRIATRSRDSLGGGAPLAAAAAWRDPGREGGGGGGGGGPGVGACAPDGLFLGRRLVPQKPVYLHHRLRRQLAQHLQGSQMFQQLRCT